MQVGLPNYRRGGGFRLGGLEHYPGQALALVAVGGDCGDAEGGLRVDLEIGRLKAIGGVGDVRGDELILRLAAGCAVDVVTGCVRTCVPTQFHCVCSGVIRGEVGGSVDLYLFRNLGEGVGFSLFCIKAHNVFALSREQHFVPLGIGELCRGEVVVFDLTTFPRLGEDFKLGRLSLCPVCGYLKVAPREQAAVAAGVPRLRHRGEWGEKALVALQQHLRNAGCSAKIAVALEQFARGVFRAVMVVEQVVHRVGSQLELVGAVGLIALEHPRPHCGAVRLAPSLGTIAAALQRHLDRILPRRSGGVDHGAGIRPDELGDVAVIVLADVAVEFFLTVLLDLTRRAHLDRIEQRKLLLQSGERGLVLCRQAEGIRCLEGVEVVFIDHLLIKRTAHCFVAPAVVLVLGGVGGGGEQVTVDWLDNFGEKFRHA